MLYLVQVVSRLLPMAGTWVRSQVSSCVVCSGKSGVETGFVQILRFPLSIRILQTAVHPLVIVSPTLCTPDADSVVT
jgi:hypothetical protein